MLPDQGIQPRSHALSGPPCPFNPVCFSIPGVPVVEADFAIVCLRFAGKPPFSAPAVIPRPLVVAFPAGLPWFELLTRDPSLYAVV